MTSEKKLTPAEKLAQLETPKTFSLYAPVGDVDKVTLREPIGSEINKFHEDVSKFGSSRAMQQMAAAISGLEMSVFLKMGARDLTKMSNYLNSFFEDAPETSET